MRLGTNIARLLTGGGSLNLRAEAVRATMTNAEMPTLLKAVVIDVVTDVSVLDYDYIDRISSVVNNPEFVPLMTPNSIIARIISNNEGVSLNNTMVFFPLFSSHFMLPINPGEVVYVIYEDLAGTGNKLGYWIDRIPGMATYEDPNYTHYDRRFDASGNPLNYSTKDLAERPTTSSPETFPNGGGTPQTYTIRTNSGEEPSDSDDTDDSSSGNPNLIGSNGPDNNSYNNIFDKAFATPLITPEPVPRWKKRPQELVLQGANNALIVLGEDRNGPISGALLDPPIDITKSGKNPRYAGAVDIVVGRGRYFPPVGENPRTETGDNPAGELSTAPLVVDNTRGFLETDKNPFRSSRENLANPNEGNPNPLYDAARVYVVQQSRVDENYLLIPGNNGGIEYPEGAIPNEQPPENGYIGRSYVVAKADHLRFIARREPQIDTESENIAGTILIVREGAKNTYTPTDGVDPDDAPDGNLAYIYFNKEGKIQVDANRIYLGQAIGEAQPYIRYAAYENTIKKLQSEIDDLRQFVKNFHDTVKNGFQTASTSPNAPYSPVTSLSPFYAQLSSQVAPSAPDVEIDKAKSKKIFGE